MGKDEYTMSPFHPGDSAELRYTLHRIYVDEMCRVRLASAMPLSGVCYLATLSANLARIGIAMGLYSPHRAEEV